jgi:hypothetical protein
MNKQCGDPIGYHLNFSFNGTRMWESSDLSVKRCPVCKYKLDFFATNPDYTFRKSFKPNVVGVGSAVPKNTQLSSTYDIYDIATKEFMEFCEVQGYENLEFVPLKNDPNHYHLISHNVIPVNREQSRLRFGKLCLGCHNYEYTVFGNPAVCYVDTNEPIPDGIYRSDLLFASGDSKHPLLFIGRETILKFKAMGFKKISYTPIYNHNL